jgi:hypothetical protein
MSELNIVLLIVGIISLLFVIYLNRAEKTHK